MRRVAQISGTTGLPDQSPAEHCWRDRFPAATAVSLSGITNGEHGITNANDATHSTDTVPVANTTVDAVAAANTTATEVAAVAAAPVPKIYGHVHASPEVQ